jgi:hypothetical protein
MYRNPLFDPAIHHRQSMRLAGYDYSQSGAYFVTICSHAHTCLLGEMGAGAGSKPAPTMRLSDCGEIVESTWNDWVDHVTGVELGPYVGVACGRTPYRIFLYIKDSKKSTLENGKYGSMTSRVWCGQSTTTPYHYSLKRYSSRKTNWGCLDIRDSPITSQQGECRVDFPSRVAIHSSIYFASGPV